MSEETKLEAAIFEAALAVEDIEQRRAIVDAACRDNSALRDRVNELLAASEDAEGFMQQPAVEFSDETIASRPTEKPGATIGRYKLLEQIGEGGFGVVYMADQLHPIERRVALKIIKLGMDSKQVVARFEAERQALALMDHPNIAKILDAGTTETGRPYFVMELVRGIPVTDYCDDRGLSTEQRLKLFSQICCAVQHAHQKGIIHRDIKPSNILVSTNGDEAVPMVIDFGIAKATQGRLTDKTLFTQFRQFIGTPVYMSPEQAQMSAVDVDTRSDIYSLGVLLYELMTGKTPLDSDELAKAGFDEICRRIREQETPKPSKRISSLMNEELSTLAKHRNTAPGKFTSTIRGDLDWIVMKAVEKDRSRRYDSCGSFAADIQRYLNSEPVLAGPPSAVYHMRKFFLRHRVAAFTSFAIALSLIVGTLLATYGLFWAMDEKGKADQANQQLSNQFVATNAERDKAIAAAEQATRAEQRTNAALYAAEMQHAHREFDAERTQGTMDLLNKYIPQPGQPDLRSWEWQWLWGQCRQEEFVLRGHSSSIRGLRFSPDGKYIVSGATDGSIRLWDVDLRREVWRHVGKEGSHCNWVDFSPDGKLISSAWWGSDHYIWDVSDLSNVKVVATPKGAARFALDGKSYWTWGGLRKTFDGTVLERVDGNPLEAESKLSGRHLSASQRTLVTAASIWDVPSKKKLGDFSVHHDGYIDLNYESAAVSPLDENIVVTGCAQGAFVWDRQANLIQKIPGTGGTPICGIDFSADGKRLAVRHSLGAVLVFSTDDWSHETSYPTAAGNIAAFSTTNKDLLATGDMDGSIRVWDLSKDSGKPVDFDHPAEILNLRFSPDGKYFSVGMKYGEVHVWDIKSRERVFTAPKHDEELTNLRVWHSYSSDFVEFAPDSKHVATIGPQNTLTVWDIESGEAIHQFKPDSGIADQKINYYSVAFAPDERLIAGWRAFGYDRKASIEVWEFGNGLSAKPTDHNLVTTQDHMVRSAEVSPDGKQLMSTHFAISGWDIDGVELKPQFFDEEHEGSTVRYSPDGKMIALTENPPSIKLVDVETREVVATLAHSNMAEHISWSADGRRLASSDLSAITKVWDVESKQVTATFRGTVAEFSPDGSILAVGGQGSKYIGDDNHVGQVTLYSAPTLDEIDRRRKNELQPTE